MDEEWRDVCGSAGRYMVSNMGRIKSIRKLHYLNGKKVPEYRSERILPPQPTTNGYLKVALVGIGRSNASIHVLVAEAFIGPRPDGMQCDHINRIKTDNRADNLRYATIADNCLNKGKNYENRYLVYAYGKWCISKMINGHRRGFGAYTLEQARSMRDELERNNWKI